MRYSFCTLFDKNFLARGMALHDSLTQHCPDFRLWMLCMDEESFAMLEQLKLENVTPLRLNEVEDIRLLAVKPSRTPVEYCWMFSSVLPLYLLEKHPDLETITYLDADIYFYAPVEEIYQEFVDDSILLIPHRYSTKNKHREKTSGIYNVGMMIFRNDADGLHALRWWKERVIEWCFNRYEDGKFGDQLYLDDWPTRFAKVHVLRHQGANVAPWNIARFTFKSTKAGFVGIEHETGQSFPLIFYHFHPLKIYSGRKDRIRPYPVTIYQKSIYKEYLQALQAAYDRLRTIDPAWTHGCTKPLDILRIIKQYVVLYYHFLKQP